ncbi:MAG: hypothetical protein KDJ29_17665, partial [Hyphomicrobiales bacterium]|nr:hypothetical protein [Hyphomicrobiales bacterium]
PKKRKDQFIFRIIENSWFSHGKFLSPWLMNNVQDELSSLRPRPIQCPQPRLSKLGLWLQPDIPG